MTTSHPLEKNDTERARFGAYVSANERAAWRRACEACTSGLPSWAERRRPGRKAAAAC